MNSKLKSKKVLIPALAAVAVLGIGAVVAVEVVDERRDEVPADVRTSLGDAALAEVGVEGAVVSDVDKNDDRDEEPAYEVEVRTPDGREYDVWFDADQTIIFSGLDSDSRSDAAPGSTQDSTQGGSTQGGTPPTGDDTDSDADDRDGRTVDGIRVDDSERPLADADVADVAAAATKGTPGTVVEIETNVADADDTGAEARTAYEVEITADDGTLHVVRLDADLVVLAVLTED